MDPNLPAKVVRLALRQHGNLTREQLLKIGLGPEAIKHRTRVGDLHSVHRGVYALGRPAQTWLERASAAVLACGPAAALSHFSALALWELTKRWPTFFDVSVLGDRRPTGIRVHRSKTLSRKDLRTHQGIRVTSPARTLLDCARQMTERALTRAVNDALIGGHLKRWHLAELLERNIGHPGARLLRPLTFDDTGPTRSELEDRFKEFCKRYGLPTPRMNAQVCGYEVDALFEEQQVIVELDGWTFHRGRDSFERDRDRDANTLNAGFPTVRQTWERLNDAPAKEAERLLAILASRDSTASVVAQSARRRARDRRAR